MPPFAAIPRTAVHAWCPRGTLDSSLTGPLLVTGTVSGALDDSFSTDSQLELWQPFSSAEQGGAALEHPIATVQWNARFNSIAWGKHAGNNSASSTPFGVIAAGLDDGGVALWNPNALLNGGRRNNGPDEAAAAAAALIARLDSPHRGPVRGLDFSPAQSNLLASGATNGEIYIWDLTSPLKPFSPGTRSRSLDSITSLAWNPSVVHILASSSNTGHTVVWDLKSKREITALSFASGGATGLGPTGFGGVGGQGGGGLGGLGPAGFGGGGGGSAGGAGGAGVGGLGGHSAVKWHPENPTKLITASEDDHAPNLLVWDLRNWKQPEKVLRGHDKGILSVNFCPDDSDLVLSSGKDGRALAWSLQSGEIVAEVTPSSNWTFESHFVPNNPSLISAAALDGELYLHSLQSTNSRQHEDDAAAAQQQQQQDAATTMGAAGDFFEQAISANAKNYPTKSLAVAPKWLRRPSSAVFGFGGRLVRIGTSTAAAASSNAAGAAAGSTASTSRVTIDRVVTVPGVVDRAEKLERAATGQEEGGLAKFCDDRAAGTSDWDADDHDDDDGSVLASTSEKESWALLKTLFHAAAGGMPGAGGPAAREKLVEMLGRGFDRDELKSRVDELAKQLRAKLPPLPAAAVEDDISPSPSPDSPTDNDKVSSSQGAAATSEPSLFGGAAADDGMQASGADGLMNGFGGGGDAAGGDDFFASLGQRPSALPDRLTQESRGGQPDASSSIAATIGSGPSSLKSVNVKQATFKLFHDEATEADKLVTQALVLGDFGSAVELALSTERYADALLFALQSGSPEIVASVQREYFARTATDRPYLRVLESISATSVGGGGRDLADVIQNADLEQNWREAFVVACTYAATDDEFSSLIEQLGQRLEYQYELVRGRAGDVAAEQWRKNAVLCYLAAGKLEKVVGVWVQQMNEDEQARLGDSAAFARAASNTADGAASATARFEAHSRALQAFIEKVSVFQHAIGYVDVDLATPTQSTAVAESGARIYKLASLYDRYIEYAELLANQGKVDLALKYVAKTPGDYDGTNAAVSRNAMKRERLLRASGAGQQFQQQQQQGRQQQAMYGAVGSYGSTSAGRYAQNANPYGARASLPSVGAAAAPATNPYSNPLATPARTAYSNPYAPAPTQSPAATSNAYNPYAPPPSAASAAPAAVASPMRSNPYAPAQPMTNPHDDPYAPAPSAQSSVPSAGPAAAAPPSAAANPYAPAPTASAGLSYASAPSASHDPYGPSTAASNPGAGLPGPPPIRTESPNFAARNAPPGANVPPPPRAKAAGGWNDVPTLPAPRRNTPAPTATAGSSPAPGAPKPAAITSPFPNSSPSGTPGPYGAPMMGAGQVPPPPPSRGANRTPAPVPPPPMTGQAAPPPMSSRVLSPPPVAGNPQYAPAPPRSLMGSLGPGQAPNGPPAGPSMMPPPPPPPQQQPAGQAFGMGAAPGQGAVVSPPPMSAQRPGPTYAAPPPPRTGTPSAPPPPRANVAPPAPPTVNGGAMPAFGEARNGPAQPPQSQVQPPPPPMQQQQQAPPPPPSGFARPPPPPNSSAPPQQQPGQVAPPPPRSAPSTPQAPQNSSFPGPPPMAAKSGPPPAPVQPPAPQPSQQAMPPQPPRMKYPPGDRSHIPPANKPIFDTLSAELQKLRQTTPPQQVKIVNDTEKRLNILFDMLNCETLSEASTQRMLELCQAVRARNQAQALDLHLQLITAGATDVTPFQAAVKLLIQRMMIPAPPQH